MRLWLRASHLLVSLKKGCEHLGQTQVPAQAWGLRVPTVALLGGRNPGGGSCFYCDGSKEGMCRDRGEQSTVTTLPTEERASVYCPHLSICYALQMQLNVSPFLGTFGESG